MTEEKEESIWTKLWIAYGGWSALYTSWYLRASIVLTALGFNFWTQPNWWDVPMSVLPNLLGFTLGGTAILFGITQLNIFAFLREKGKAIPASYMSQMMAPFTVYVLVQASALLSATVLKSVAGFVTTEWPSGAVTFNQGGLTCVFQALAAISWFLFIYAVTLTIAAGIEVFRIADMLQDLTAYFEKKEEAEEKERNEEQENRQSP